MLARCLEQVVQTGAKDGVPSALRKYEDLRGERTAWIVRRSRVLGRIGQIENPLLCRLRDAVLKATPTRIQLRQLDQVLRYEERLG